MKTHRKDHVASGSFVAGGTQPRLLQAFLGTCVGVAIVDETAGIGGLIHLLLPEPINLQSVDCPHKYASTGIPIFIAELVELGAHPENMRAVVAGGALVGPLAPRDMNLDIGGRTADTVMDILRQKKIAVVASETGGFFTCTLELDMQNWRWHIRPAGFDVPATQPGMPSPAALDIAMAIESVRPIPQVALKVLRIMQEGEYDIGKIAEEVKTDQVISARTIQLCNSALFSKSREVCSLDHALVFLGQELFLKLVISAAVNSYYSQCGNGGYSLCKGGLYHHAVGTAMIAEKIAAMTGKQAPAVAYTAGLLHDIGKVVLDHYIAGTYPMLYREFQDRQAELIDVENRILSMDHPRTGEMLARQWSLPDGLTEAIRFHHDPEKSNGDRTLTTIVYLADLLMSRFHTGLELERLGTDNLTNHLSRLDLPANRFDSLVDLIPLEVLQPAAETTGNGNGGQKPT
ncbi:HDOD domain-containing protein [uncultured Desulfosarcina sp.]|uniref:HDOD domain-containing protein n=1 Tax=uncultured Desulfosarcina sp. TaxID=218289 RepID=UPI0029C9A95D|nr:HDOD domain-containing protein [uncultured Desulfosarcina sp.]